nr:formin-like protein 1 [Zonotrichia albicollis]
MPGNAELEERFGRVLNSMNLPPDKMKLLNQYDNEKKWELICDQERFQVKNPPSAYIQKLKSYLDTGGVSRKFKRRVQESTQVLRELEISLRTNYIGWVQEFLNEENKGLDVLLEYLAFAQCSVAYDMESSENSPGSDKGKERSLEDLNRSSSSSPTQGSSKPRPLTVSCCLSNQHLHTLLLRHVHPCGAPGSDGDSAPRSPGSSGPPRLNPSHSRKTLRNSRLVSQKDDVHVCIMCLRAIMNYQSGFSLVMNHPACVNEITLSLNNKSARTKALVLELLAAVCLVRGGHDIILAAFDNFKEVCGEKNRFEKLMEYFRNEDSNIDFMVSGCWDHPLLSPGYPVPKAAVLSPGHHAPRDPKPPHSLSKDAEDKGQWEPGTDRQMDAESSCGDGEIQEPARKGRDVGTKDREMEGSVWRDREMQDPDTERWRDAGASCGDRGTMEQLRVTGDLGDLQQGLTAPGVSLPCRYDQQALSLDFLELLLRFLPTEYERSLIGKFEREQQAPEELSDEDQFMVRFSKIPRLAERMNVMIFLGSFGDTAQLLMPQLNAIIAASMSLKSSSKLRHILEIVLAFGNYMNSSKRGAAYGFRLQSLDAVGTVWVPWCGVMGALPLPGTPLGTEKTARDTPGDRGTQGAAAEMEGHRNLLWGLRDVSTSSRDGGIWGLAAGTGVGMERKRDGDTLECLQQGMELTRREFMRQDDSPVLKDFLKVNSEVMEKLQADSKTAKEAYESAVEYFGENPKTSPPTTFFPMFMRFIKAYKKAEQDIELWKKQEAAAKEAESGSPGSEQQPELPVQKARRQQMDMIAELKKRQMVKEPLIYEGKDGAIEDIISALKTVPFTARTGKRSSRLFCDVSFNEESPL